MSHEKGEQLLNHFTRDRATEPRTPALRYGLHTGVVSGTLLPNNLVTVRVDDQDRDINCVWAADILGGLLGFKTSYVPPIKTRVVVFYTGEGVSYILKALPQPNLDPLLNRSVTDPDAAPYSDSQSNDARKNGANRMLNGHKMPIDLVEGEIDLSNLMGVGITFLRHLASLQAGDLARVECHLMDDMVRVISGAFKHHSAIGDHRIYNDGGKLNMEWHGSGYDYEAYGNLNPAQARVKMKDQDTPDLGRDSQIDGYTDDGRWRLSQYVGWLGDFVNLFVTDPVQALGRLASDQLRSGKFRCHINEDGTFLVQSVSEIVLEKVVRIPVPVRIRREDDPTGNRSDASVGNPGYLKDWKPSNPANPFEMAFQLREYARWLNSTWSLARFHQMSLDFKVPTEADTPEPDRTSDDTDKYKVNGDYASWREGYATIRILRDGSCLMMDAYGNSILTTKTGVHISSAQDLVLEAAGSVNVIAGRDINMTARQNINLAAVLQAVRIKAQTGLQMLVAAGNAILDFIGNRTFKVNGSINVNDKIQLDGQNGEVIAEGQVTALMVAASITQFVDDHYFHLFAGVPAVDKVEGKFKFQDSYGSQEQYQSLTQSALERGEQQSSSAWDLSSNAVPDKGSPWPGPAPTHKKAQGGKDLNKPSSEVAQPTPTPMAANQPIQMKVQS